MHEAAEGQAARVASVTRRLQAEVGRDEQRQAEAERELSVARAAVRRRDRVSGERPEAAETCVERRGCVLSAGVAQVEAEGAARQAQVARDQLAWWRVHAKKIVGRARQRSAAAAETERSAKRARERQEAEVEAKRARTQAALKRARDAAMAAEAELEREARRQSAVWSGASWALQWARDWAQGGAARAAST